MREVWYRSVELFVQSVLDAGPHCFSEPLGGVRSGSFSEVLDNKEGVAFKIPAFISSTNSRTVRSPVVVKTHCAFGDVDTLEVDERDVACIVKVDNSAHKVHCGVNWVLVVQGGDEKEEGCLF